LDSGPASRLSEKEMDRIRDRIIKDKAE
jgi:hypothetical protein